MPSDRLCRRGEICAAKLDRMPIPHRLIALRCPPRPWPTARRFHHALVAQPDRVVASEAIGRGFESLRARHLPCDPLRRFRPGPCLAGDAWPCIRVEGSRAKLDATQKKVGNRTGGRRIRARSSHLPGGAAGRALRAAFDIRVVRLSSIPVKGQPLSRSLKRANEARWKCTGANQPWRCQAMTVASGSAAKRSGSTTWNPSRLEVRPSARTTSA